MVDVVSKFSASGTGTLTIQQLQDALDQFPSEANITKVELGDSQRDGAWWVVEAQTRSHS